jgi:serine phosphatase RsbU (regulator of sigma subunit)
MGATGKKWDRSADGSATESTDASESLGLRVRVIAAGDEQAARLARELERSLHGMLQLEVGWQAKGEPAQILFVDAATPGLDDRLRELDRSLGQTVFLILREGDNVPAALVEGRADDVLVSPFRSLEVLSKLRYYERFQAYRESLALNAQYAQLVERLREDLVLAERMQKLRLPRRFPEVKGFKVTSRYLAGERSGGDYVDLAETRDGQSLAIVLTDASNYRVSSAVLDAISRRMGNLQADELRSCVTAARRIRDGVLESLSERDHLSLFYGVLSRKDYRLRFLNLGGARLFYARPGESFAEVVSGRGDPIVRAMGVRTENEGEIALEPSGRLALVSDGFVETAGGPAEVLKVLDQHRGAEAADALNELVFRAKRGIAEPDGLPVQDCTAVLFDVDSRVMRLA